ncbi:MAG: minor capsid protein [Gorillibacterium sp.]|nr:minor capsid protein [Gorillibacterium sp.]
MKIPSDGYWAKRAEQRMVSYHRSADTTIHTVTNAYDKATADLTEEINRIFRTFGKNGQLTPAEAHELLNKPISPQEWGKLKVKLGKIKDPDIRRQVLTRLNAPAYRARITRLQALQEQVYLQSKLIADVELAASTTGYVNTIKDAYSMHMFDIQQGIELGFQFTPMPEKTVEAILKNPWSGKHFSKRIWGNTDVLAGLLSETITAGFMSGAGNAKMVKDIQDQTEVAKHAAARLVRTETTYMANAAEMETYDEAEIERYMYVATLDSRTSEVCRAHDRKVYNVKDAVPGKNMPPLHPYCRSSTRAYFGEEFLEKAQRRARDPVTGKVQLVPASLSYEDWFKQYAEPPKSGKIKGTSFKTFSDVPEVKNWEEKVTPKWLTQLTDDERESISKYTGSSYENINNHLRGLADNKHLEGTIASIRSGIDKFDLSEDITVFRGLHKDIFGTDVTDLPGIEFKEPAFMSTTLLKEKSSGFTEHSLLEIRVPAKAKGAFINPLSNFKDSEYEFLLDAGTSFRIVEATKEDGIINIIAEVILNDE